MKLRNSLLLLLTATIWGVAFVAQSVGMQYVGPMHLRVRAQASSAVLVLLPVIAVLGKSGGPHPTAVKRPQEHRKARKTLADRRCVLRHGAVRMASTTQQIRAAVYAGRQGRIPHRVLHSDRAAARPAVWPQSADSSIGAVSRWRWLGLYFLCMAGGSFGFAKGDLIGLACALLFSIHIHGY